MLCDNEFSGVGGRGKSLPLPPRCLKVPKGVPKGANFHENAPLVRGGNSAPGSRAIPSTPIENRYNIKKTSANLHGYVRLKISNFQRFLRPRESVTL